MNWYCDAAPGHPFHQPYHDEEYGYPLTDEAQLFERLCLEIFQAGLSWLLVLKKRDGMLRAFDGFDVDKVAAYGDGDLARLMADAGIIRNRRKLAAIVENARRVQELRDSHGSFALWLAAHHPRPKAEWVTLFRQNFRFMGVEVVNEFLMSIGYLPGAHRDDCPVFARIAPRRPPWMAGSGSAFTKI